MPDLARLAGDYSGKPQTLNNLCHHPLEIEDICGAFPDMERGSPGIAADGNNRGQAERFHGLPAAQRVENLADFKKPNIMTLVIEIAAQVFKKPRQQGGAQHTLIFRQRVQ